MRPQGFQFLGLTFLACTLIQAEVSPTTPSLQSIQSRNRDRNKENLKNETSLASLEAVLSSLDNLTAAQRLVWNQQNTYEQRLRTRHREEEEREAARTRAFEEQQHFLKEIWATLSRRTKSMLKFLKNGNKTVADPNHVSPKDCADLYLEGEDTSGVYKIRPSWAKSDFLVYCDMESAGGGWTVIHRWGNYSFPSGYFRRSWAEYKDGFGDLNSAFWLGNDLIYSLTSQGVYDLRFDVNGENDKSSLYRSFWIENENQKYTLHVEGHDNKNSNGEDIFSSHNGRYFSTFDRNNNANPNAYPGRDCSSSSRPGWWFKFDCVLHQRLQLSFASITSTNGEVRRMEMKIRPSLFQKMKETS